MYMLAILKTNGKQFIIKKGNTIKVHYIKEEIGSSIKIDKAFLIKNKENYITRVNYMLLNNNTSAKMYFDNRNTTDTTFLKTQTEVQEDGTILYINDL